MALRISIEFKVVVVADLVLSNLIILPWFNELGNAKLLKEGKLIYLLS